MNASVTLKSATTPTEGRVPPRGNTYTPQEWDRVPDRAHVDIDTTRNAAQPPDRIDTSRNAVQSLGQSNESQIGAHVRADTVRLDPPNVAKIMSRALERARSAPARVPDGVIQGLQKWNGRIVHVDEDWFEAELIPEGDAPTVLAEFDLSLLGDEDVAPGDVVYVTVRTVRGPGGLPHRTSQVRLRHLGLWDPTEVADVRARATALEKSMAEHFG